MPTILTPVQTKIKALFAKIEATYDTAATIAGADYIEARNISITPFEAGVTDRNIQLSHRGKKAGLTTTPNAQISFDVAIAPSGTRGTAPKWGRLLLAAGFAETVVAATSVTYSLISSGDSSLTMDYFDAQNRHRITGARASSLTFKLDKQGIPMISLTYIGIYQAVVAASGGNAMPVPDYTGWTVEQIVDSRFSTGALNGGTNVPVAFSSFQVNMGLETAYLDLPGPQTSVDIRDRAPTLDMTFLAPPLVTLDPFALVNNSTPVTGSVAHGTGNGKIATINFKSRLTGVTIEDVEGLKGYKVTGGLEPVLAAGNDELALVLT
jgi:hypothetical protein